MEDEIKLIIDKDVVNEYSEHYFKLHPRASNRPIKAPYHESINQWMIMKRPQMNGLKQRWKEFIKWFVDREGYTSLGIQKCEIYQRIYYPNHRRHDIDNTIPKFILDGLVESGMIVDDDMLHLVKLTLQVGVDLDCPRTEMIIKILEEDNNNGE